MSNALAIAAVTEVLKDLIYKGVKEDLDSGAVTAMPPDKAREKGEETNQINLFLYQTVLSAAWRNTNPPEPISSEKSPLALQLYYLVTAYGKENEDVEGHLLLGKAMRILHDYPILHPDYIEGVLQNKLPKSDLHQQIDLVRITPQPLSLDELSKLWTTFQTQYRISTAYQVSVVLIDSSQQQRRAMPVLTRGNPLAGAGTIGESGWVDRGIIVQPNLLPPFPTFTTIQLRNSQQPSIRLGESLTLKGYHLDGVRARVLFAHAQLSSPNEIIPVIAQADFESLPVTLPDQPNRWPAGFYRLSAVIGHTADPKEDRTTNELAITLAPQIQGNITASRDGEEEELVILRLTCRPNVWPNQRVSLILNVRDALLPLSDREIPAKPRNSVTDVLEFESGNLPSGDYEVRPRLRVDGVDSFMVQDYGDQPPQFIDYQPLSIPS